MDNTLGKMIYLQKEGKNLNRSRKIVVPRKEPRSNGKTMKQLIAQRKQCKDRSKKRYWTGRIQGLKGRLEYTLWLEYKKK